MDNVTLNKLELASELAHDRAQTELMAKGLINYEDLYIDSEDTVAYTETMQEEFNYWYDYYLTRIEEVAYTND
jgi:hypothetical protein